LDNALHEPRPLEKAALGSLVARANIYVNIMEDVLKPARVDIEGFTRAFKDGKLDSRLDHNTGAAVDHIRVRVHSCVKLDARLDGIAKAPVTEGFEYNEGIRSLALTIPMVAELLATTPPASAPIVSPDTLKAEQALQEAQKRSDEVQAAAFVQSFQHDMMVYEAPKFLANPA
jgi:hypothetical protein